MMTKELASRFADEWIRAWNAHDLERVLRHYAADVEFVSPFVGRLLGGESDTLRGIEALRDYFGRALAAYPDLKFVARRVYTGARSLVIEYQSVDELLAAELFEFNGAGKVRRVLAHYSAGDNPN